MQAFIKPEQYTSQNFFDEENVKIFENLWIFACMRSDIDHDSHYGIRIGSSDLVIQLNEGGQPRAFFNSCSHRGSLLCEEGKHGGRVRCPYHGWVYDKSGVPVGIPNKECFPEVVNSPSTFKLKEVSCSAVGKFIFISLAQSPSPLREFLGEEYEFLESISPALSNITLDFIAPVRANWKAVIENSLEGYHVPMVHQKTFLAADGMSKSTSDITNNFNSNFHSSMNNQANDAWLKSFENKFSKKIGQWPYRIDCYTHHHIFPNLTITSFLGYSFHLQNFKPQNHDLTTVHSRTFGTNFQNQSDVGRKLLEKIYVDSNQFTLKVFEEDTYICEKVQKGLKNSRRNLVLGIEIEDRVRHFQKAYASFI
ncbi:aromatic ring-hydroxylating dioxygenase subunit alpha [Polynucleobacter sp. AP-Feld-500C-C5]|uniref:aromatic ring-hydroxylating oxygenase subunit alpha n=1 Tax=Polynucleobacter sp. AP-Feld-500C-C5 TaxID=2576924 RepID=UPI001C0B9C63|nr:aromatic ring-hydroxylating dioxygenase subunit alpha [Polynucleobacter sp. AP-Feld-500C-C5]MBU3633166.1 aromatic ring-hydroxylating dioxygenase subunit alpha [Polynucleobacter sp. AP-Feld-500C-C5]